MVLSIIHNWNLCFFKKLSHIDKIIYCISTLPYISNNKNYYSFILPDNLLLYIIKTNNNHISIKNYINNDYIVEYDIIQNSWIIIEKPLNKLYESIHSQSGAIRTNANYFLKLCKEDSSYWNKVPTWNDIQNINVPNMYNQESIYIPIVGNDIFKVRISAHDKNKNYASDINVYITSNKKDAEIVEKGYKELKKYNSMIPKLIPILKSKLTNSFCVRYIKNYNGNPKTIINLIQTIKLPTYVKNFNCFKTILKNKCEQVVKIYPSLKQKYMTMGISYYNPSENNQIIL